jgi:hypothetical protein
MIRKQDSTCELLNCRKAPSHKTGEQTFGSVRDLVVISLSQFAVDLQKVLISLLILDGRVCDITSGTTFWKKPRPAGLG